MTDTTLMPVPTASTGCEQSCPFATSCPFMRWGQQCPEVREVEAECVEAGVNLWDVLRAGRHAR
jgi:hypothetical protein